MNQNAPFSFESGAAFRTRMRESAVGASQFVFDSKVIFPELTPTKSTREGLRPNFLSTQNQPNPGLFRRFLLGEIQIPAFFHYRIRRLIHFRFGTFPSSFHMS